MTLKEKKVPIPKVPKKEKTAKIKKVSKQKEPLEDLKSPTPEDSEKSEMRESSPEKSMEVDEPSEVDSEKYTEPISEDKKSSEEEPKSKEKDIPSDVSEPFKKVSKKASISKPTKKKPSYDKHDVELTKLGMQEVEIVEKPDKEKPAEKESIFVSGVKLKKSSIVKREIEKSKLETVDLVSHDDEGLPVDEEVSLHLSRVRKNSSNDASMFLFNKINHLCFIID